MNNSYINFLKSEQKSPLTISNYTKYINQALSHINKPDNQITYADLVDWKASIAHLSPNSICLQIAAVKSYFGFLYDIEAIKENPAEKLKRPVKKNKEKPYPDSSMVRSMVDSAKADRDKAMVLLFATTGLRFSELAGITINDYKNMSGEDNREIVILGKGAKERTIYVNDEAKLAIDMYLTTRPRSGCDKLFVSNRGNELDESNVNKTLKKIAKDAGIPFYSKVSPHWLRAAFATTQSEAGTPVATIQAAMGHSSLSTTSVYIKHSQKNINNAMRYTAF